MVMHVGASQGVLLGFSKSGYVEREDTSFHGIGAPLEVDPVGELLLM